MVSSSGYAGSGAVPSGLFGDVDFTAVTNNSYAYGGGGSGYAVIYFYNSIVNASQLLYNLQLPTPDNGINNSFAGVLYSQPTITAASTQTTTDASTVFIQNAPTAGANQTITNAYALQVASGSIYVGGPVYQGVQAPLSSDTTINYATNQGSTPIIPLNPSVVVNVTLPAITQNPSVELYLVNISPTGIAAISVANPSTEAFDNGAATILLSNQFDHIRIKSLYNVSSPAVKVWLIG
jgi:hypothetical protein